MSLSRSPSPPDIEYRPSYLGERRNTVYHPRLSNAQTAPPMALSGHRTLLQGHADSATHKSSATELSTLRAEAHGESFYWDSPPEDEVRDGRLQNPCTPPTGTMNDEPEALSGRASSETVRRSRQPSFDAAKHLPTRKNTSRSSMSSIARGLRRGAPDLRVISAKNESTESTLSQSDDGVGEVGRRLSNARTRSMSLKMPTFKKASSFRKEHPEPGKPKVINFANNPPARGANSHLSASEPKSRTLKDRRKVRELPQLTLPPSLAHLPARSRRALSPSPSGGHIIGPPRSRSPKTPFVRNDPLQYSCPIPSRHTDQPTTVKEGPSSHLKPEQIIDYSLHSHIPVTEPVLTSTEKSHQRLVYQRSSSGGGSIFRRSKRSEASNGTSPGLPNIPNNATPDEKEERHVSRLRGHFSPTDAASEMGSTGDQRERKLSHVFKFRKFGRSRSPSSSVEAPATKANDPPVSKHRQAYSEFSQLERIKSFASTASDERFSPASGKRNPVTKSGPQAARLIPYPPVLNPPEKTRVPTPPLFDASGEVKGKLADFFFDVGGQRVNRRQAPKAMGGVWDSDALLMSQEELDQDDGDDEAESPGIDLTPSSRERFLLANKMPASPFKSPTYTHLASEDDRNWFRVRVKEEQPPTPDHQVIEDEQLRERLEWITPEHLPNSPLCPLNPKYRGTLNVCVYHGRRKKSLEVAVGNIDGTVSGKTPGLLCAAIAVSSGRHVPRIHVVEADDRETWNSCWNGIGDMRKCGRWF